MKDPVHQQLPGTRRRSYAADYVARVNAFIATCPQLEKILAHDGISCAAITGPSVTAPQVKELDIIIPMRICQDVPLGQAFPNLEKLAIRERVPMLSVIPGQVDDFMDVVGYQRSNARMVHHTFQAAFPKLEDLELEMKVLSGLPEIFYKIRTGDQSWIEERHIKVLLGKCSALKKLTIKMAAPCMLGENAYDLVRTISASKPVLRRL